MGFVKKILGSALVVLGAMVLIFFVSRKLNNPTVKEFLSA